LPIISRRKLLAQSLMAGVAVLATRASLHAHEYGGGMGMPWRPGVADEPHYGTEPGTFLTDNERSALDAFTARLIPSDDTGPGAREADLITFIDRQLAGYYGRGQRWYMQGPFSDPLDTQGYQSEQPPAQLIRDGLAALDAHCRHKHDGRGFAELSEDEQDAVLTALDEEEIEFNGLSAKAFFDFVHEITIEGFFADPIYGGNRNMAGWRLVGFPGARYDYRDYLDHNGAPIEMPPVGLMGRPEWISQRG
jgi:gluconate 2-dehydrogenase gamma chain